MFEDSKEMLTQELIMKKTQPNRLGTKFQDAFVKDALDQNHKFESSDKNILKNEEPPDEVDDRFSLVRQKSKAFYEPLKGDYRNSLPLNKTR